MLRGNFAMEIWNTGSVMEDDLDSNAPYWDELLAQGQRIFGVATDDGHAMNQHCKGWVMRQQRKQRGRDSFRAGARRVLLLLRPGNPRFLHRRRHRTRRMFAGSVHRPAPSARALCGRASRRGRGNPHPRRIPSLPRRRRSLCPRRRQGRAGPPRVDEPDFL